MILCQISLIEITYLKLDFQAVKMKLSSKFYFHFKEEDSIELHIWNLRTTSSWVVMK